MKKISLLIILSLLLANCKNSNENDQNEDAQKMEKSSDSLSKNKEKNDMAEIPVMPVSHASFAMRLKGKVFYFDPVGGADKYSALPKPDIVLITHKHGDHFDVKTLQGIIKNDQKLIVPKSVQKQLPDDLKKHAMVMNNGDEKKMNSITIKAIPMYNLPAKKDAFHPKGRGNGYLLDTGKRKVYISGDTEDIPEMKQLKNIDLAFVCMNLPYTMPMKNAAKAVLTFKPKKVIPYHYRGKNAYSDVKQFKKIVEEQKPNIDVELLNWYPNRDKEDEQS